MALPRALCGRCRGRGLRARRVVSSETGSGAGAAGGWREGGFFGNLFFRSVAGGGRGVEAASRAQCGSMPARVGRRKPRPATFHGVGAMSRGIGGLPARGKFTIHETTPPSRSNPAPSRRWAMRGWGRYTCCRPVVVHFHVSIRRELPQPARNGGRPPAAPSARRTPATGSEKQPPRRTHLHPEPALPDILHSLAVL